MPYDEFEQRAFAPDEAAATPGRFTRTPQAEPVEVA